MHTARNFAKYFPRQRAFHEIYHADWPHTHMSEGETRKQRQRRYAPRLLPSAVHYQIDSQSHRREEMRAAGCCIFRLIALRERLDMRCRIERHFGRRLRRHKRVASFDKASQIIPLYRAS